jgi:endogenous inhibitor of DNA gyrase (YacG/DUF329 family)
LYKPETAGKCPHCRTAAHFAHASATYYNGHGRSDISTVLWATGSKDSIEVYSSLCPECHKPVVVLQRREIGSSTVLEERVIYPLNISRPVAPEVPPSIRDDFVEAAAVLSISEKASAALSRRCLQNVLTDQGYDKRDLNDQIEGALRDLPKRIGSSVDVVRNIGNFAAHPMKHQTTGLVVDVEPEEANWNLDVLEELFEYYYVQPKRAEEKRKKLDQKLQSLGKPALKTP